MSIRQKTQEGKKAAPQPNQNSPTEDDAIDPETNATIMIALANLTALVTGIHADMSKRLDSMLTTQEDSFRQFSGQVSKAVEEQKFAFDSAHSTFDSHSLDRSLDLPIGSAHPPFLPHSTSLSPPSALSTYSCVFDSPMGMTHPLFLFVLFQSINRTIKVI